MLCLKSKFKMRFSKRENRSRFYEKNLSAKQLEKEENSRISFTNEHKSWKKDLKEKKTEKKKKDCSIKIDQSFPRDNRITKRSEFINIQKKGVKINTPHFVIFALKSTEKNRKIGITVGKKIGNAVKRNQVKRGIREFFRKNKSFIKEGLNIIIIAKSNVSKLPLLEIGEEIKEGLIKNGLYKKEVDLL